jgi:hypothetical protein
MNISVIITYSKSSVDHENRWNGLVTTLECCKKQTFKDYEIILAEHTRDGAKTYLPFRVEQHLVIPYDGIFNKSWISNVAARSAKHDFILSLDADTIFGEDYFQKISDYYETTKNPFFNPWSKIECLTGRDEPTPRWIDAVDMKAAAHAWAFDKTFYWKIGGMNEKYFGYGAEDQDLWERAQHTLKAVPIMQYELKHVYHHFHPRESNFPLNEDRVRLLDDTKNNLGKEIARLVSMQDKLGRDKPCA